MFHPAANRTNKGEPSTRYFPHHALAPMPAASSPHEVAVPRAAAWPRRWRAIIWDGIWPTHLLLLLDQWCRAEPSGSQWDAKGTAINPMHGLHGTRNPMCQPSYYWCAPSSPCINYGSVAATQLKGEDAKVFKVSGSKQIANSFAHMLLSIRFACCSMGIVGYWRCSIWMCIAEALLPWRSHSELDPILCVKVKIGWVIFSCILWYCWRPNQHKQCN
jgi:hypothetical protein